MRIPTLLVSATALAAPVFGAAAPTLTKVFTTAAAVPVDARAVFPPLCSWNLKKGEHVCPSTTKAAPVAGATVLPICTFNPVTGKYDCPGDEAKPLATVPPKAFTTAVLAPAEAQATSPPLCTWDSKIGEYACPTKVAAANEARPTEIPAECSRKCWHECSLPDSCKDDPEACLTPPTCFEKCGWICPTQVTVPPDGQVASSSVSKVSTTAVAPPAKAKTTFPPICTWDPVKGEYGCP